MPTVPTYESHVTLNPTPLQESRYADASKMFPNTAPDFTKVSAAMMAYQKKVDTSRAMEAENQALQYIYDATYGDNGYLKLQGKNALERDENGEGLQQRILSKFDEFTNKASAENQYSPSQMQLIAPRMAKLRLQLQSGVGAHILQEQQRYAVTQFKSGMDLIMKSAVQGCDNPAVLETAIQNGKGRIADAAKAFGMSKEEQGAYTSSFVSGVCANTILGVLAKGQDPVKEFELASQYFEAHKKDMTDNDLLNIQAQLRSAGLLATQNKAIEKIDADINKGTNNGAKAASLGVTNGKRSLSESVSLIYKNLTYPTMYEKGLPAVRGKDGWGISGLNETTAREVFNRNKEKFQDAEFSFEKFQTDKAFNYTIGMAYFGECVKKHPESVEEAVAAYRFGEKTLEEAKAKGGADWLNHLPEEKGGKKAVLEVVQKVADAQDGRVYVDGKLVSALTMEYASMYFGGMDNGAIDAIYDNVSEGALAKSPLERAKQLQGLYAYRDQKYKAMREAYRNNVHSCQQAIFSGTEMPAEALKQLPVAARDELRDLQNRVKRGYQITDQVFVNDLKKHPDMLLCSQADYETYIRPRCGERTSEIDMLRYSALQESTDASERKAHLNFLSNKGVVLPAFSMTPESVARIWNFVSQEGLKMDKPEDASRIDAITMFLAMKAQSEGNFDEKGRPTPFTEAQAKEYLQNEFRQRIRNTGLIPKFVPVSDLTNRGPADSYSVLKGITMAWGNSNYDNYTYSDRDAQYILTCLTMGNPPKGFNPPNNSADLIKQFHIDEAVWKEACSDVKREMTSARGASARSFYTRNVGGKEYTVLNPAYVMGRYFQILSEGREINGAKDVVLDYTSTNVATPTF